MVNRGVRERTRELDCSCFKEIDQDALDTTSTDGDALIGRDPLQCGGRLSVPSFCKSTERIDQYTTTMPIIRFAGCKPHASEPGPIVTQS